MQTTYSDPSVARVARRRKPLPVWFWLAVAGCIILVSVASLAVVSGWSILHPFETKDERVVREALESKFRPIRVESAEYVGYDEEWGWHTYHVKYWRPSRIGEGWISITTDIVITDSGSVLRSGL